MTWARFPSFIPSIRLICIDAGGVLLPSLEFSSPHQKKLHELLGFHEGISSQDGERLDKFQRLSDSGSDEYGIMHVESALSNILQHYRAIRPLTATVESLCAAYLSAFRLQRNVMAVLRELANRFPVIITSSGSRINGFEILHPLLHAESLPLPVVLFTGAGLSESTDHEMLWDHVLKSNKVSPRDCLVINDRPDILDYVYKIKMNTVYYSNSNPNCTMAGLIDALQGFKVINYPQPSVGVKRIRMLGPSVAS